METTQDALFETHLDLPSRRAGKVRDVYELPGGAPRLLIVATDRVSAFDVVLPTPVSGKGRVLTDISTRWLEWIENQGIVATHLISTDQADIPGLSELERAQIAGRVTIGKQCRVVPIECVVRGYLAGSGWVEYQQTGRVCDIALPKGLVEADRLPEPIFTPATKADLGEHDENISFQRACEIAGDGVMRRLRDISLEIYSRGADYARERGVIIADTKFEFGFEVGPESGLEIGLESDVPVDAPGAEPILIDEALTPDSSRFWPIESYQPGQSPPSFDKQYVRDHLLALVGQGAWDKSDPGPALPDVVVRNTLSRYEEARSRLFG